MTLLAETGHIANGQSAIVKLSETAMRQANGYTFFAVGTWDTATAKVQISPDGTTWVAVASGSLTANGYVHFMVKAAQARIDVSSVGATTDLDIYIF